MPASRPNPQIIDLLNDVLTAELTAINQYFLHGEICGDWGYSRLYKEMRGHSIDEMKHAERVMERIHYLKGLRVRCVGSSGSSWSPTWLWPRRRSSWGSPPV